MEGSDYRALLRETFGLEFQQASAMREKMNHATNDDYDRMIGALGPEISLKEYMKRREARGFLNDSPPPKRTADENPRPLRLWRNPPRPQGTVGFPRGD